MEPILVVDDQLEVLNTIKEELDSQHIESSEVDNTTEAIELLKLRHFSCLFLDIIMGDTSSEKVIEFLKSPENTINSNLPVVVMSGYVDPIFIERVSSKVFMVIEKPFEKGLIKRIIEDLSTQENRPQQETKEEVHSDIAEEETDPMDFL